LDLWIEDQLDLLLSVKTKSEFLTGLTKAAELLEFDYFAYGLRVNMPLSAPKIEMLNNYPKSWQDQYGSQNYLAIDPTVQHGMHSMRPVVWSEELFVNARPLWDDARSFGLRHGWAQSTLSMPGISGMMTLARSSQDIDQKELKRKTNLLVWLTQIAHQGLQEIILPGLLPEASVKLTNREIEILRWTADGKTSSEVSMILGIAERTVNFHLNNVMEKLNVINKTAAVVKAIQLGLI
jgi:LuxR family transcriptional regulator